MKTIVTAFALALSLGSSALAAPASSGAMASVKAFIEGINKGDIAAAGATQAADVTIIDEMPPYHWRGPDAFQAWAKVLTSDPTMTEAAMTLGKASRADVTDGRAYLVVPAVFTFKAKGQPMREPGQFTFVVRRAGGGWKIAAWTWAGGKARPVLAPVPAAGR